MALCSPPQGGRGGEALCDLQHGARIRLRRALQPVRQPEGVGASLPPDVTGPAQRLPERTAGLPRLRTDAIPPPMSLGPDTCTHSQEEKRGGVEGGGAPLGRGGPFRH